MATRRITSRALTSVDPAGDAPWMGSRPVLPDVPSRHGSRGPRENTTTGGIMAADGDPACQPGDSCGGAVFQHAVAQLWQPSSLGRVRLLPHCASGRRLDATPPRAGAI